MTNNHLIIKLLPEHACQLAKLHISGISTGFISSLGLDFVTALYETIAESSTSFGFIAEKNGKVVGFVAFTSNLHNLYKSVILKKGVHFAVLLAGKLFSLKSIKNLSSLFVEMLSIFEY